MHTALLTYPPEGASVQYTIYIDGTQFTTELAYIPAGSAPYVKNMSCPDCYTTSGTVTVFVQYTDEPSTSVALSQDTGFAITSFAVTSSVLLPQASVSAAFSGLTVGTTYTLRTLCNSPLAKITTMYVANSASTTNYNTPPGSCATRRYLTITSPDGAHIAVRGSA